MANVILRIYIPRKAKAKVRSWRHFGRKKALSRYLLEKAQEAAIGEVELSQVMTGYIGGDDRHPPTRSSDIPDCLDICGLREDLWAVGFERSWLRAPSSGSPSSNSSPPRVGSDDRNY